MAVARAGTMAEAGTRKPVLTVVGLQCFSGRRGAAEDRAGLFKALISGCRSVCVRDKDSFVLRIDFHLI